MQHRLPADLASLDKNFTNLTAAATVNIDEWGHHYICDSTDGSFIVTIPAPVTGSERIKVSLDTDDGDVTLQFSMSVNPSTASNHTKIIMADAGDYVVMEAFSLAGAYVWRPIVNNGGAYAA